MEIIRSPFFYVGDKYKLMTQLLKLFPENIDTFIEPFVGGGSVFLNTKAEKYLVNDLDSNIINLHKLFYSLRHDKDKFLKELFSIIEYYDLSCSFLGKTVPDELKEKYVKTYYAKYNKENYIKMRSDFNENGNIKLLYLLLVYGFNHMIRFNKKGEFNLPVGNVDFNNNTVVAINNYLTYVRNINIDYSDYDYIEFLKNINFKKEDFIYFDPPYLLSNSEYNKLWNDEKEKELYDIIDYIDSKGIKFGLSNLLVRKNQKNAILEKWMDKYDVYDIKSNYISYYDNSVDRNNREVYITNYEKSRT